MSEEKPPDFSAVKDTSLLDKWNLFDKAASKDIKWWFFALLMIGMGYAGFERWQSAEENKSLRQEITDVRKDQMAFVISKNEAMMSALMNNTEALKSNTQTLMRIELRKVGE